MREVFRRAARRFTAWNHLYYYACGKTALDPAYQATVEGLKDSPRPLLDIGCGIGLLAACLREAGHRAPIVGLDLDEKKIAVARQMPGGRSEKMDFRVADALEFPEHHGDVVMLDVLHYFSDEDQQRLLRRIAECVAPGGAAYIRTTVNEAGWRFLLTKLEEFVVHYSGWIPSMGSNFATREEIEGPFRAAGLEGGGWPMWGWTPFNGYLFVFRRPAG